VKAKFEVGAELDLLNSTEAEAAMLSALQSWSREVGRGVKYRTPSATGRVAGGVWTIDGRALTNQTLGPDPGMVWSVMRAVVSGGGIVLGTDLWNLYHGDANPSKLIDARLTVMRQFNIGAVVLTNNDVLVAQGVGTGAGTDVTLALSVVELPYQLAWQLL
jgi:hypothetical protein